MGEYTDIASSGWVASLPPAAQPYAILARLDRPIGAWLLFLPGLWSLCLTAHGARLPWLILLFGVGSVLMRSAGCVINDMWDRELDRKVTRTASRPLAAGTLSLRQATVFLAALLSGAFLVLLQLNRPAQLLAVGSLVLVACYPLAKRVTWWPQLMLGVTFGWGAPVGYVAGAGHLSWSAAYLYAAAICWILGYDTIYAHQDREDDALVGVRSTARLFAAHTQPFLAACYAAAALLLLAAGITAHLTISFYLALASAAALLGWQVLTIEIDDPALCLRLFKLNRDVGLMVALGLLAGRV